LLLDDFDCFPGVAGGHLLEGNFLFLHFSVAEQSHICWFVPLRIVVGQSIVGIEACGHGVGFFFFKPEMPFADRVGVVLSGLEHFRDGDFLRIEAIVPVVMLFASAIVGVAVAHWVATSKKG